MRFNNVEWGSGREEPSLFNPTALDADQWVSAMEKAGGKMIVLVCKHHDGLCQWQTRYTSHSVAASPWLDGKGSVVKAVAEAARKHGIETGRLSFARRPLPVADEPEKSRWLLR